MPARRRFRVRGRPGSHRPRHRPGGRRKVHLSDLSLFDRYNKVYATYFPDPRPVRTTVGSQLLGVMIEIDVIAYVGDK